MKLPELSVIDTHLPSNTKIRGYTAEQMLAWGKANAEAEREACAKVCEGRIGGAVKDDQWWRGFRSAMAQCAEVIRARRTT